MDFIRYFPYETSRIAHQIMRVRCELVLPLREELHRQKFQKEQEETGRLEETFFFRPDNKEGFLFLDENWEEMGVLFKDGYATFGKLVEWKRD